MNVSTFGVKRSKFQVTVDSNMLENALFGLVDGYGVKVKVTAKSCVKKFGTPRILYPKRFDRTITITFQVKVTVRVRVSKG